MRQFAVLFLAAGILAACGDDDADDDAVDEPVVEEPAAG